MATRFKFTHGIAGTAVAANGAWAEPASSYFFLSLGAVGTTDPAPVSISHGAGTAADRIYVSAVLKGTQTISGTVSSYLLGLAPSGTVTTRLEIYVVSEDGATIRGTLLSVGNYGTGSPFSGVGSRSRAWALGGTTLTPVGAVDGDRIVVIVGYGAASSFQAQASWGDAVRDVGGGPTADIPALENQTTGIGWIEFSQTIAVWQVAIRDVDSKTVSPPAGTTFTTNPITFQPSVVYLLTVGSLGTGAVVPSSVANTNGGLTWQRVTDIAATSANNALASYFAVVPSAAPAPDTIVVTYASSRSSIGCVVKEISVVALSNPIVQSNQVYVHSGAGSAFPVSVPLASTAAVSGIYVASFDSNNTAGRGHFPKAGWGQRLGVYADPGGGLAIQLFEGWDPFGDNLPQVLTGDDNDTDVVALAIEFRNARPVVTECPTVVFIEPAKGQMLPPTKPVVFRAFAAVWRRILTRVSYPLRPDLGWEMFHDGTGFAPGFIGPRNARVALLDPAYEFRALPNGGWPASPSFKVYAVDAFGLEAKDVDDGCTPGIGTTNVPTLTLVSPASLSQAFKYVPITVDMKVASGVLKRGLLRATYEGLPVWDFIFDGDAFSPKFANPTNQVQPITDGIRVTMLPDGGWKKSPKLTGYIISDQGVEA